jgi:hypothetical protein
MVMVQSIQDGIMGSVDTHYELDSPKVALDRKQLNIETIKVLVFL